MNTKILIIIGALVVIAGGAYVLLGSDTQEDTTPTAVSEATQQESASESINGTGSFQALMRRGENVRCDFSSIDESAASEGVFYYSGGKYRVEAEVTHDGGTQVSNMIGLEDTVYVWGTTPEGEAMALMLPAGEETDGETDDRFASAQGDAGVDLDAGVRYNCEPWRVDQTLFEPPADIEFVDMQTMFESMFEGQLPEGFEVPADLQVQ